MSPDRTFIIVGGGLAGAKAAETLRAEGFDGRLLLFGEEPVRPYERPPMSKTYLRRESSFDDAAVHDADFYKAQEIELHPSTVVASLDPAASQVQLAAGARIQYERVLLATGAAPRRPNVPGVELEGFHLLRTVADSDAIHAAVTSGAPLVVIGAGWIGSEVAASARQLGADVTMIDLFSVPLERVLGLEVGAVYRDLHAAQGVKLRMGVGIQAIKGAGRVEEVRLSDGSVLPAGAVVAGIGVLPRTDLAAAAGLHIDNGVLTDEYLATSAPGVYAAGDVASAWHPTYGVPIRLEHWSAALNQGPAAARNMLGIETPYVKVPYFFSDQYDLGMEYRGWAPDYDRVVFRGDPAGGEFIAFWLRDGVVMAAMNANVWDQGDAIDALLAARCSVDPAALADPGIDLAGLAGPAGGNGDGDGD
jgi:3-phenylpropionate/trans-cinnamate dioxygenase ferredoxin reductase subunit